VSTTLTAAAALFAALAIWGRQRRAVHYVAKPLATLCIAAIAATAPQPSTLLLAGLAASLLGDILLMFARGFLPGLVAFLAALVIYSIYFGFYPIAPAYALVPAVPALVVVGMLAPHLGKLKVPVVLYVLAMTLMVWRAVARLDVPEISTRGAALTAAGALLFMLGDTLLARRKFMERPAPYAVELGTYYLAQWCIVTGCVMG
jgi:uncharacterized membrane protein YhhN